MSCHTDDVAVMARLQQFDQQFARTPILLGSDSLRDLWFYLKRDLEILVRERDYFDAANTAHEEALLAVEAALGGCRPPLVEGSRVQNILAYVERLRAALQPFADKVHDDGDEAPYPSEHWSPLLFAAKKALS